MNVRAFSLISLILAAMVSAYLVFPIKPGHSSKDGLDDLFYGAKYLGYRGLFWEHGAKYLEYRGLFLEQSVRTRLSDHDRFILFDTDTLKGAKALLDSDPQNPVFFGHYFTLARIYLSGKDLLPLIKEGNTREPENARFDWVQAALILRQKVGPPSENKRSLLLLDDSSREKVVEANKTFDEDKNPDWLSEFKVNDRQKLDKAMELLRAGAQKVCYRSYSEDLLKMRMDAFGDVDNYMQAIERVGVSAGSLLPALNDFRKLTQISTFYAFLLAKEGRKEDAEDYAMLWRDLAAKLQQDSPTLIGVLVIDAIIGIGEEKSPALFRELGEPEKAETIRREATAWSKNVEDWKSGLKKMDNQMDTRKLGLLDRLLLPDLGRQPDDSQTKAGRLLDYHLVDSALIRLIPFLLCIPMFAACLILWRWRAGPGEASLRLKAGENAAVFFLGALLPLTLWRVLSGIGLLSGRDFNVMTSPVRPFAQFAVVGVTLVYAVAALARHIARQHAQAAGITPPIGIYRGKVLNRIAWGLLGAAAIIVYFPMISPTVLFTKTIPRLGSAFCMLSLIVKAIPAGACLLRGMGRPDDKAYYSAVCQSVIPTYAIIVLLLAWGPVKPLLRYEKSLVQHTSFGQPGTQGFTTVEWEVVQDLKKGLEAATPESLKK